MMRRCFIPCFDSGGHKLSKGTVVHHKNRDKTDNRQQFCGGLKDKRHTINYTLGIKGSLVVGKFGVYPFSTFTLGKNLLCLPVGPFDLPLDRYSRNSLFE